MGNSTRDILLITPDLMTFDESIHVAVRFSPGAALEVYPV